MKQHHHPFAPPSQSSIPQLLIIFSILHFFSFFFNFIDLSTQTLNNVFFFLIFLFLLLQMTHVADLVDVKFEIFCEWKINVKRLLATNQTYLYILTLLLLQLFFFFNHINIHQKVYLSLAIKLN